MSQAPEFRLVAPSSLHPHERVEEGDVRLLVHQIRTQGMVM